VARSIRADRAQAALLPLLRQKLRDAARPPTHDILNGGGDVRGGAGAYQTGEFADDPLAEGRNAARGKLRRVLCRRQLVQWTATPAICPAILAIPSPSKASEPVRTSGPSGSLSDVNALTATSAISFASM
jgi:hypothetical protein